MKPGSAALVLSSLPLCLSFCFSRLPSPFPRGNCIAPYHSPAPVILQRLPFSSAYPSSSACHSPAPAILPHLPSSSDYHSPAPAILQRLPFSSQSQSSLSVQSSLG